MEIIKSKTPKKKAQALKNTPNKSSTTAKLPKKATQSQNTVVKPQKTFKKDKSKKPKSIKRENKMEQEVLDQQRIQKSIEKLVNTQNQCFEIFEEFINQKVNWPKYSHPKKIFYLIEDIAILFFVAKSEIEQPGMKFWDFLVQRKIFRRTPESLNHRYYKYLSQLTQANLLQITTYLIDHGVNGYLIFTKNFSGEYHLDSINPIDEKEYQKKLKKRIIKTLTKKNLYKTVQKPEQEEGQQPTGLLQKESKQLSQERTRTESCLCNIKDLVQKDHENNKNLNRSFSSNRNKQVEEKNKIKLQTDFQGNRNVENRQELQNIEKKLQWFESNFELTRENVLEELTNVSGNWNSLLAILKGKNLELKWNQEEDQILRSVKNAYDPNLKKLIKKKGEQVVVERMEFLQIYKNFI